MQNAPALFLLFHLGKYRFALEATTVQEVLPMMEIDRIGGASEETTGILNYRGVPIPVIDLSQLLSGRPSERRLSTRIILVPCPGRPDSLLGLLAERATMTIRRAKEDFVETGVQLPVGSPTGPVLLESDGLIQWIKPESILPRTTWERNSMATPQTAP